MIKEPPPSITSDRSKAMYLLDQFQVVTKLFDKQGREIKLFRLN